jgi:putative endonuclease
MPKPGFVYIMTNRNRTTLYIGVTSDIERRVAEHGSGAIDGFTKEYNLHDLIYFEHFPDIKDAIDRETVLKKWSRFKKDALIRTFNPMLKTLTL